MDRIIQYSVTANQDKIYCSEKLERALGQLYCKRLYYWAVARMDHSHEGFHHSVLVVSTASVGLNVCEKKTKQSKYPASRSNKARDVPQGTSQHGRTASKDTFPSFRLFEDQSSLQTCASGKQSRNSEDENRYATKSWHYSRQLIVSE